MVAPPLPLPWYVVMENPASVLIVAPVGSMLPPSSPAAVAVWYPTPSIEKASNGFDTDAHVNHTGGNYICYCWTEIPGFSKFGRYKGNGNTNGPYIDCGFRPAFVMMKEITDASTNWVIYDDKRNTYNPVNVNIYPNLNSAEGNANLSYDFYGDGFKVLTTNGGINADGDEYIYIAFADQIGDSPYHTDTNAR